MTMTTRLPAISLLALALSLALFGCETVTPTYEAAGSSSSAAPVPTGVYETRILYTKDKESCVFAPSEGDSGGLATLAPALIDTGLTALKNAITAAAAEATANLSAYVNVPPNTKLPKCITVISGRFGLGSEAEEGTKPRWFSAYTRQGKAGKWRDLWQMLQDQNLRIGREVDDAPDFYFEALLVAYHPPAKPASEGHEPEAPPTYFKLVPTFIAFTRPGDAIQTVFRPDAVSRVTVTFGIKSAGSDSAASAVVDVGYLTPGTQLVLNSELLTCAGKHPDAPCAAVPLERESQWSQFAAPDNQPLTFSAGVAEVRTVSATLAFFGDLFDAAKPTISSELQNALIDSKAREAHATSVQAEAAISDAYDTALSGAADALSACADKYDAWQAKSDDDALRIASGIAARSARAAEKKLNNAAAAAHEAIPFGTLLDNASLCRAHYKALPL